MGQAKKGQATSDLNNWNFCNPDNFSDKLPQPYRSIANILESDILKQVDKKIFEIEDMKNNPSYEGNVKKTGPSGIFEMSKITTICQDILPNNQLLVGDCDGKVSLMDLGRKNLTGRVDATGTNETTLPIIHIKAEVINYGDYTAVVFSTILKGSSKIKIFMYTSASFQMFHIFTINLPKNGQTQTEEELTEESDISNTAMSCLFTRQAQYCLVTLFSGE